MVFAIALGVSMIASIPITYIIIHVHATSDKRALFGDKLQPNEDDNPLPLTVKAMEAELAELHENNIHMKRIAQLEEQIKEARAHAEALSKVVGNYGNTMEEVGESIVGSVGGRDAIHTIAPVNSNGIVIGGILSKGLVVEKPKEKIESAYESESETNHEAFDDAKPDWEGYTNSLLNKDHNLISHTKGSIYQGDYKDIQGLLDYVEEELHLTGDTCLRFGSRTRFFSIVILLHNLSLDEFKSKVSYWDKSYGLLLANKESYGVKRKLFEQEVFNFEEFRQAVLSYFKEKEEVFDEELTRQNTAIYRTYTRQAGWSTYYDVTFK